MVNHPSAGNFSNEVDGDCCWNPERSLCHCSSCEATVVRAGIYFHYASLYQVCIVFKPRVHLNRSQSGTEGLWWSQLPQLSALVKALAVFQMRAIQRGNSFFCLIAASSGESQTTKSQSCDASVGKPPLVFEWIPELDWWPRDSYAGSFNGFCFNGCHAYRPTEDTTQSWIKLSVILKG